MIDEKKLVEYLEGIKKNYMESEDSYEKNWTLIMLKYINNLVEEECKVSKVNKANIEIDILGTQWTIIHQTIEENEAFIECDGYCDTSVKKIYYRNYNIKEGFRGYEDRELMQKKTLRHEIIHAFLYESGLWRNSNDIDTWSMNEEMIDWIAIQFPKIQKVFNDAGCI